MHFDALFVHNTQSLTTKVKKVNMKKSTLIKVLISLIVILLIFVGINVLTFTAIVKKQLKSPLYPEARAYMACAEKINDMYILPLSHMTHWEHPITKPFYAIRDKLYNKGLSLFPKNEGEREVWWYKIHFLEYLDLVDNNLYAYQRKFDYAIPKFVFSKVNRFHDWDNELYSHIQPMANEKITDKELQKYKLNRFVEVAESYVSEDSLLVLVPGFKQTWKGPPLIHWVSDKEVEKYDKVYQTYINLLEYSKKYDKPSYDYFYNDITNRMAGWFLAYDVSKEIMMSRFYNDKLICDDFYLKLYNDNHKIMKDYYDKNGGNLSYGVRARMSMASSEVIPIIACKFHDCPNFKDYSSYAFLKIKEYNHFSTWEQVKNNELSGLEQEKRYDELKRTKNILKNTNKE